MPIAAAAAVAALASASAVVGWGRPRPGSGSPQVAGSSSVPDATNPSADPAPPDASAYRAVLDLPGWTVNHVEDSARYDSGEISYSQGDQELTLRWSPAESYADYVDDREHILDPPAPGEPIEVLGLPAQLWAYSSIDHTVIREVQDGHWLEIRGGGMGKQAFVALLGQTGLATLEDFEALLPEEFVTTAERPAAVRAILDGIASTLGPDHGLTPSGTPEPELTTQESDPYDLGADVSGAVACTWLDAYTAGPLGRRRHCRHRRRRGAGHRRTTGRSWSTWRARATIPAVLWEFADDAAAGRPVPGYRSGLGCA